jgi:NADH-ubiquinone oxidoreductase chain 2
MIFISIITLIAAKALPLFKKISSIHISRIASIVFIYTGACSFNCFYIQSIGSGIGIYNGLFHITPITQLMEIFLFIIGGCILIGWPQVLQRYTGTNNSTPESYSTDYSIIVLFSILGSSLLISSFDLISVYLSIELQSYGCAPGEAFVEEVCNLIILK